MSIDCSKYHWNIESQRYVNRKSMHKIRTTNGTLQAIVHGMACNDMLNDSL